MGPGPCGAEFRPPSGAADLIYADHSRRPCSYSNRPKAKIQVWTLARYFESERIDTFCRIASAAMVLNAARRASARSRGSRILQHLEQDNFSRLPCGNSAGPQCRRKGVTLDQTGQHGENVRRNGRRLPRRQAVPADQFRELAATALESTDHYIIVNFSREKPRPDRWRAFLATPVYDRQQRSFS